MDAEMPTEKLWIKAAPEIVAQLLSGWSEPLEVRCERRESDGELDLVFRKSVQQSSQQSSREAVIGTDGPLVG